MKILDFKNKDFFSKLNNHLLGRNEKNNIKIEKTLGKLGPKIKREKI